MNTSDAPTHRPAELRPGVMIRVTNPRSTLYGATGHIIGRSETANDGWVVRFTTVGSTELLHDGEMEIVVPRTT